MDKRYSAIIKAMTNIENKVNKILMDFEEKPEVKIVGDLEGFTIHLNGGSRSARNAIGDMAFRHTTGYSGQHNELSNNLTQIYIDCTHSFCK